jgi:NAD dependent epimerase/dehydratase
MKRKILVTGAAGFIGSHLTELLIEQGFEVKAFIHYNSRNYWGWLEESNYKESIEVVSGDIRDYDSVYSAMSDCREVYHLAALIGIPYSYISPQAYIKTNIDGTYNVLQAGKLLGIEKIIITSTSETYGSAQYVPINEIHPIVGQSPYSATKIAADQMALSYFYSFNMPIKIVRPFNTFGPRQSARAIIPAVITQLFSGGQELSLGNLHPTRDLTFVKDTVSGFYEIAKSKKLYGEVTNIGMGKEISIKALIELISKLMDHDYEINLDSDRIRPENSEVTKLLCDNNKILSNTNWKPQYDLESGLKETIKWITTNLYHFKESIYNV